MTQTHLNKKFTILCVVLASIALGVMCITMRPVNFSRTVPSDSVAEKNALVPQSSTHTNEGLHWSELSRAQRQVLSPLGGAWEELDTPRKQKWIHIANRYASMKIHQQQRLLKRMQDWASLTPEQRSLARENYAQSNKVDAQKKNAQWAQYRALPEDQKKKLAGNSTKRHLANLPPPSEQAGLVIPPFKSGIQSDKSLTVQALLAHPGQPRSDGGTNAQQAPALVYGEQIKSQQ